MLSFIVFKSIKMVSHDYDSYVTSQASMSSEDMLDYKQYDLLSKEVGLLPFFGVDKNVITGYEP